VILAAFSFTLSIGGLVGLLAFLLIKALQDPRRDIARIFVRCVLIISIAIVLIYVLLPDLYVQRVIMSMDVITSAISTQNPDLLLRFGTTRGDIWQAALKSITVSPLMGHGPGNGSFEIIRHSLLHSADYNMSAHNMFLAVGADLGLIGLALFCLLLASAIWSVRPLSDSRTYGLPLQRTGETIFVALVVYVVQGLALDIHNLKLLWVLMGMAIAYRRLNVLQNQEMTKTRIPK
jgi:O-antigen ligase